MDEQPAHVPPDRIVVRRIDDRREQVDGEVLYVHFIRSDISFQSSYCVTLEILLRVDLQIQAMSSCEDVPVVEQSSTTDERTINKDCSLNCSNHFRMFKRIQWNVNDLIRVSSAFHPSPSNNFLKIRDHYAN